MASGTIVILVCTFISCVLSASFPFHNGQHEGGLPRCQQPPEPGLCLAYFQRFFYNASTGKCQDFVYGGCRGNLNNFVTEDECMKACATGDSTAPRIEHEKLEEEKVAVVEEEEEDVCSLPQEPGLCYALIEKYYFNGEKCEAFNYGGCGGNKNNFDTIEECSKTCPPKSQRK